MKKAARKKMTSRTHVIILLIVSMSSIMLLIGYTDTIQTFNFLPSLSSHVKSSLCSVWTTPCDKAILGETETVSRRIGHVHELLANDELEKKDRMSTYTGSSKENKYFRNEAAQIRENRFGSDDTKVGVVMTSHNPQKSRAVLTKTSDMKSLPDRPNATQRPYIKSVYPKISASAFEPFKPNNIGSEEHVLVRKPTSNITNEQSIKEIIRNNSTPILVSGNYSTEAGIKPNIKRRTLAKNKTKTMTSEGKSSREEKLNAQGRNGDESLKLDPSMPSPQIIWKHTTSANRGVENTSPSASRSIGNTSSDAHLRDKEETPFPVSFNGKEASSSYISKEKENISLSPPNSYIFGNHKNLRDNQKNDSKSLNSSLRNSTRLSSVGLDGFHAQLRNTSAEMALKSPTTSPRNLTLHSTADVDKNPWLAFHKNVTNSGNVKPFRQDAANLTWSNNDIIDKSRNILISSADQSPRKSPSVIPGDNADSRIFSPRHPRFSFPQRLDFVSGTREDEDHTSRFWLTDDKWRGRNLSAVLSQEHLSTLETDYQRLQHYLETGGLNMTRLSMEPWPREVILPWEMDLLKTPPLTDLQDDSSYRNSKVTLLNWKDTYAVGDRVRFRIDIYDGAGRPRQRGGDEIRLWVVEKAKLAASAGQVTDLNNGSYFGEVVLRWPGALKVKVELTFSRAALRTHFYYRYAVKCIRFVAAGFIKGHASEATLCSHFPLIPGYLQLCNFTEDGIHWYCGKPRTPSISCGDWVSVRDTEFARPMPLSEAESKLSTSLREPPALRLIPTNNLVLYADRRPRTPWHADGQRPCSSRNFSETWNIAKPRGYFFARKWKRTDCQGPKLTISRLLRCLTGTTLVFTGDSNLLMLFNLMVQATGCAPLVEYPSAHWHRPRSCTRLDIQFHMAWALHGFPAHSLSDHWAMNGDYQKVTTTLKAIPARGKFVVVLHLFIHMSIHHYSVFVERMAAIRRATEDLLARNPNAKVVVRGPHTSYSGWPPVLGGDMMGTLFRQITVRAFEGLHDRVLFLDFWDMTIAAENPEFHPPAFVNKAMLGVLFGHLCAKAQG